MSRLANTIVHINGWPGTGKLTIGLLLAERLGAKLVDNHTMINPAEMLFSRRDPLYRSLRADVRRAVLDHVARAGDEMSFLFTDALSDDGFDTGVFSDYVALAKRRNARLIAVVLDCDEEENLRRLALSGRKERGKLTDPDVLKDLRGKHRLLRSRQGRLVELDVSDLAADAAADRLSGLVADAAG